MPGMVATRPAFEVMLSSPIAGNPNIVSHSEYQSLSGSRPTVFLDSNGALWINDPAAPSVTTLIADVVAGLAAKFENAFGKLFAAMYSPTLSSAFSPSPFVGAGIPVYYNGTSLNRVTTDAPGISPTFSNLPTVASALTGVSASSTLTVTAYQTAGLVSYRVSGTKWGPGYTNSYYTQMVLTCSSSVPAGWLNQNVAISGLTGSEPPNGNWNVVNVNGSAFTIAFTAYNAANVTGQSGSAALANTVYLQRNNNVVTVWIGGAAVPTGFQQGFWASVTNGDGSIINGPNWTISTIARSNTGLVTVTISTGLTNLTPGTLLYISATDVTDFPAGYQTVYEVLSATSSQTVFTYQSVDTAVASSTGGNVYQTWSPQFGTNGNAGQITAIGVDTNNGAFFQFFQLGPNTSLASGQGNISSPQAQIQGQIPSGIRNAVLIFQSQDGAQTAPSQLVQLTVAGGPNLLQASNVAIGPPGTTSRILAFTPYGGASWYYVAPATVPAVGNNGPQIATGTIINDNVSTNFVMDFSDAQLTAGVQIDADGNNLFNQFVLPPCLGVMEYSSRMHWWGAINNVRNMVNMGFDGGYIPPFGTVGVIHNSPTVSWVSGQQFITGSAWVGVQINLGGILYTILSVGSATSLTLTANYTGTTATVPDTIYTLTTNAIQQRSELTPPGWTGTTVGTYTPTITPSIGAVNGFAVAMPVGAQLTQAAYQDQFGAPILQPNTTYTVRFLASVDAGGSSGQIFFQYLTFNAGLQEYSTSGVIVSSTTPQWYSVTFPSPTWSFIPTDLQFTMENSSGVGFVLVDELEIFPATQPVESDTILVSYEGNPFGYDAITGQIGIDSSDSITAMFKQRGYAYVLTELGLYQTQNNGQTEPSGWTITPYASKCGCSGPNAVSTIEDVAWWIGRYGGRQFTGNPSAKKITQEIASDFEQMNWTYQTLCWVADDPVQRIVYFGVVRGNSTTVSDVFPMNYRLNDSNYDIPDPVHVSQYSGRMLATDLGRKWTIWNPGMNSGAMCTRPSAGGLVRQMLFAGSGHGNLYTLDVVNYPPLNPNAVTWNVTDSDYGAISSWYTTYFFPERLIEQNPIVQSYRKIFNFIGVHITGVGQLVITPYIDSLANPWTAFPAFALRTFDPGFDYNLPWFTRGDRQALKFSTQALGGGTGGAFALTLLTQSCKQDMVFPIRGSIL